MGGRDRERILVDRETWITEVSDSRLAAYERLVSSSGVAERITGERRIANGDYFKDLVRSEVERRKDGN